jgi:hypothetical protein
MIPRHRLPAPRWNMEPVFPIANGIPLRYSTVATWALVAADPRITVREKVGEGVRYQMLVSHH